MTQEPAELIARCLAGDRDAQRELYELHHRNVYRLVVRMVGRDAAEDVTQEVFVRVFRGLRGFRKSCEFSTWLYRIVINECLRKRAGRDRLSVAPLHEEPVDSKQSPEQLEASELLEHALTQLDDQLRAVFLLRESEGLSYADIANVLKIPAGTVASQLNRAKTRLREILRQIE